MPTSNCVVLVITIGALTVKAPVVWFHSKIPHCELVVSNQYVLLFGEPVGRVNVAVSCVKSMLTRCTYTRLLTPNAE